MDWSLHDRDLRHERLKVLVLINRTAFSIFFKKLFLCITNRIIGRCNILQNVSQNLQSKNQY